MKCNAHFRAKPKRSFLGFQKLRCPHCAEIVLHPLTTGYRIVYWVCLILFGLGFAGYLSGMVILWPGVTGMAALVGAIVALSKDAGIRKNSF